MHSLPSGCSTILFFGLYLLSQTTAQSTPEDHKRGLVYVPNKDTPADNKIWTKPGSPISWYYNYRDIPSPSLASSTDDIQFVPMLWGTTTTTADTDTRFLDSITSQLEASPSPNLTHVLSFNEPDGDHTTGGSAISPGNAAQAYILNLLPLRSAPYNISVGLPAITGSQRGIDWLKSFNESCAILNSGSPPSNTSSSSSSTETSTHGSEPGCPADFLTLHWYGTFEGLASFLGQMRALYPTLPVWVTEYGLPNAPLEETQAFYNTTREYFERLDYVDRFSYFGAFRSSVSNVGASSAFLTEKGELTDIGSWYLGGGRTGNVPSAGTRFGSGRGGLGKWVLGLGGVVLGWSLWIPQTSDSNTADDSFCVAVPATDRDAGSRSGSRLEVEEGAIIKVQNMDSRRLPGGLGFSHTHTKSSGASNETTYLSLYALLDLSLALESSSVVLSQDKLEPNLKSKKISNVGCTLKPKTQFYESDFRPCQRRPGDVLALSWHSRLSMKLNVAVHQSFQGNRPSSMSTLVKAAV